MVSVSHPNQSLARLLMTLDPANDVMTYVGPDTLLSF